MKQRIKSFYERVVSKDTRFQTLNWKAREAACLQYLLNLIGPHEYIADTVMAMSSIEICHIINEVEINQKHSIIEFGSGNSTIYIAKYIQKSGRPIRYVSVDSSEEWIRLMEQKLKALGLLSFVQLVFAPIVSNQKFIGAPFSSFNWYDTAIIDNQTSGVHFDLVIVDGPNGSLSPLARFPAVPYLKTKMSDSPTIFLDDTNRSDEQQIVQLWLNATGLILDHQYKYVVLRSGKDFISLPK